MKPENTFFRPMIRRGLWLGALAAAAATAGAQTVTIAPPQGVLNITANASVEVAKDLLAITFTATRDGADAATVQAALKQALDAALAEARKAARPQEVEVQTGNFSLYPRYAQKGGISGWQGTAELVVQGRDMNAIAQLSGRIQTMTIGRVSYGLSREAAEKVEGEVTAQAVKRFQARANELARQFGYGGASVREVQVSTNEPGMSPIAPKMYMRAAAASDESLPVEAGKGTVTATVSGTVQMK
ncbi:SIMPL domain-containing protein [Aquincola sp. MAHUQ-54]|uniref:SIMPL domain-containing protein n=1 Tax=Aquincola agrisoli TaxID=3119538 RepID=A0AAW9QN00_9BURK